MKARTGDSRPRGWANQAGWSGPCAGKEKGKEKEKESGPPGFRPKTVQGERKAFLFSKCFMNFQTNLNSNQS
jgi:hypothetical protein